MARIGATPGKAVDLSKQNVVVDSRVVAPAARAYADRVRGRAPGGPTKYTEPVAGGPAPNMPILDSEAQMGVPMAQQAYRPPAARPNIVDGELPMPNMGAKLYSSIQPGDMLPDEAKNDPAFRDGAGSMVASNQPGLAAKYGIVRRGQRIPPQQLAGDGQKSQLRSETVEGLRAINEANTKKAPEIKETPKVEDKPLTEEEKKEILDGIDDFDLNRFKNAVMKDLLNNTTQQEIIEKRVKPLDIVQLVVEGSVTQVVPIHPNKFEPEFQSNSGEEDLTLKRWLTMEAKGIDASDRYFMDKYSLMGLTVALKAINKKQLPTCYDSDGNLNEELFWAKYKIVSRFNYHMLGSLMVNWFWFDVRVRKLFVAEELGNG